MADFNPISGVINAASKGIESVAGVFTTNKEKDAQRSADEQMALLQSYQAEFHQRSNRSWVDIFADGFNRLIRPFIVTLVLSIFIIAYISPEHLVLITTGLNSIPEGYWTLLSVIIAFYFGGRMQLKSQEFKFNTSQAEAVKTLIQAKKEFRKLEMDTDEPDRLAGEAVGKMPEVDQDRAVQSNPVVELALKTSSSEKKDELTKKIKEMQDESVESVQKRRKLKSRPRRAGRR
ncbi:3TM-type holin [Agarilytica rhodophyticola]|uniref:3TM-type holin n=1 Tax=Agarilytica rhodophyticola TaxID=1737490 RepID=UPI000B3485A9|nr:3TM-type holin [Agarilytica rhodophyticola]